MDKIYFDYLSPSHFILSIFISSVSTTLSVSVHVSVSERFFFLSFILSRLVKTLSFDVLS